MLFQFARWPWVSCGGSQAILAVDVAWRPPVRLQGHPEGWRRGEAARAEAIVPYLVTLRRSCADTALPSGDPGEAGGYYLFLPAERRDLPRGPHRDHRAPSAGESAGVCRVRFSVCRPTTRRDGSNRPPGSGRHRRAMAGRGPCTRRLAGRARRCGPGTRHPGPPQPIAAGPPRAGRSGWLWPLRWWPGGFAGTRGAAGIDWHPETPSPAEVQPNELVPVAGGQRRPQELMAIRSAREAT